MRLVFVLFAVNSASFALPGIGHEALVDVAKESCLLMVTEPLSETFQRERDNWSTWTTGQLGQLVNLDNWSTDPFQSILEEIHPLLRLMSLPAVTVDAKKLRSAKFLHLKLEGGSLNPLGSQIIVLDKKLKDRTCLLTEELSHTELAGEALDPEAKDAEDLLTLLNKRCFTFLNLDGSINSAGVKRAEILSSLFTGDDLPPSSPSMADLHKHCSEEGTLEEFFYSGKCPGEQVCRREADCKPEQVMELPTCERLQSEPSWEEFFEHYLSKSRPVILPNAARKWAAFAKWSPGFLRRKFGQHKVHVKLTPSRGEFEGVESISLWNASKDSIPHGVRSQLAFPDLVTVRPHGADVNLSQFLDAIESTERQNFSAYLEYSSVKDYLKDLQADYEELPWVKRKLELKHTQIWLSDGNTLGKLHFDQFDNFLAQLRGRKQVMLMDPSDNVRLGEGHLREAGLRYAQGEFHRDRLQESTSITMAPFDIQRPDFERLPQARSLRPLNCTLNEGDVLYLPSFWWHEVQSFPSTAERRNLALNFWYDPFLTREFPCAECKLDVSRKYRHLLL